MSEPIDTKKLQALCERVARKCEGIDGDALPIAKDHKWAELVHDALPELTAFIFQDKEAATPQRQPIETEKQLPSPDDTDRHGRLWLFDPASEDWCLRHMDSIHEYNSDSCGEWSNKPVWTYWLPFKLLPLPEPPKKYTTRYARNSGDILSALKKERRSTFQKKSAISRSIKCLAKRKSADL